MRRQYGTQIPGGDPGDHSDLRGVLARVPIAATAFAARHSARPGRYRPAVSRVPSIVSHWIAKVKSELHPSHPEEAQLLAEMNLPIAAAQAKVAEQAAKQSQAAAETAMREAERAQRDAARMQRADGTRREERGGWPSRRLTLSGLDNLDSEDAMPEPLRWRNASPARNVRMQIAAARLQAVSVQMQDSGQAVVSMPESGGDAVERSGQWLVASG